VNDAADSGDAVHSQLAPDRHYLLEKGIVRNGCSMVLGLVMAANLYDSAFATLGPIFGGGARKRMPILTVEPNGRANRLVVQNGACARGNFRSRDEDRCRTFARRTAGNAERQACTPERIQADEQMLAALAQVSNWRWQDGAILLVGPTTMKFHSATN
jgi:hypothetical protein